MSCCIPDNVPHATAVLKLSCRCRTSPRACRNLKEWIEYHLLIGVQQFYLLTNECDQDEHVKSMRVLRVRRIAHCS